MSTQGPQQPRRPAPPPGRAPGRSAPTGEGPSASRAGPSRSRRPDGDGPTFLAMIGVVAIVVATVIVVFFVIGYVLGRLFL